MRTFSIWTGQNGLRPDKWYLSVIASIRAIKFESIPVQRPISVSDKVQNANKYSHDAGYCVEKAFGPNVIFAFDMTDRF